MLFPLHRSMIYFSSSSFTEVSCLDIIASVVLTDSIFLFFTCMEWWCCCISENLFPVSWNTCFCCPHHRNWDNLAKRLTSISLHGASRSDYCFSFWWGSSWHNSTNTLYVGFAISNLVLPPPLMCRLWVMKICRWRIKSWSWRSVVPPRLLWICWRWIKIKI